MCMSGFSTAQSGLDSVGSLWFISKEIGRGTMTIPNRFPKPDFVVDPCLMSIPSKQCMMCLSPPLTTHSERGHRGGHVITNIAGLRAARSGMSWEAPGEAKREGTPADHR